MKKLVESLVKELINDKPVTAVYGGGFKPPTKGHFELVKQALNDFPEIDKFIIYVGGGVRDGISQEESLLVWNIYKKYLGSKIEILPSKSPIGDVIRYGKNNPDEIVYFVIGAREGRDDDIRDVESRTRGVEEKYPNMRVKIIRSADSKISGTNARKALKISEEDFIKYLPLQLTDEEKSEVYNILSPFLTEVGEATQEPYKWTVKKSYWEPPLMEITYNFTTDKGIKYQALFYETADYRFDFMFYPEEGNALNIINKGELFRVMSTIVDIMKDFIKKEKWSVIEYSSVKQHDGDERREKLYAAYLKKNLPDGIEVDERGGGNIMLINQNLKEADPKKGTGKKPKGSGRRLYTDEDPKDTVGIKFSTRQDIVDTLNKTSFKNKSHARQSQIINLIHQRVRAAYGRAKDPDVKKRLKTALDYAEQRKEASKAKTQRLKKQKNENVAPNHDGKAAPFGSGYDEVKEQVNFKALEKQLDNMFAELDIDVAFTNHFKERVIERGLTEEDIIELANKIIDKYPNELDFLDKDQNIVMSHLSRLIDIAAINTGYGDDYLKDLVFKTAFKRKDKSEPEFRTNKSSPRLSVTENTMKSKIDILPKINELTLYMIDKGMNVEPLPKLELIDDDTQNAADFFGKTAYYDPNTQTIVLYTCGRHPKDIVRSYAHEMIHHIQNLEGRLGNITTTNTQEDDSLNDIEAEANLNGTMTFRNWTDSLNEGKQVGPIYHYTTFEAGLKILQSNQLKSSETADSTKNKPVFGISFTRDKRFHDNHNVGFDESSFGNTPQLRFTIDGNKLSNRFSVQPYSQGGVFDKGKKSFEAEERVISIKPFSIPLSDYLISVDVLVEYKKPGKDDWAMEWDYKTYAPIRAKIIKFAQSKNLPINLIVNKNGDPWPDRAKETLIKKILNWFTIQEANLNGTMTFRNWTDSLNEIGDASQTPYKWVKSESSRFPGTMNYDFVTDKDTEYRAYFVPSKAGFYEFGFSAEDGDLSATINKGELFRVMSTIVDIMKDFVTTTPWDRIEFEGAKDFERVEKGIEDKRRDKLYRAYLKKHISNFPNIDVFVQGGVTYLYNEGENSLTEYDNSGPSTPKVYVVKDDGTYKEAPIELLSKISNLTYDMGGGETNYYPEKNIVIVDNIPVEKFSKNPGEIKDEKIYVEYNLNNPTSFPKADKIIASQLVYHLDDHEAFAQTVANSLKDGGTFDFQSDLMNKKDKTFLQHLSDEYGFGLPTKLNQYKQQSLPLKKGEFVEPVISYTYKITDKDGKTSTLSITKKGNSWEWKKIDGNIDFKTGEWSKPPEDFDPDFRDKKYTLRAFDKYLEYYGDSNTIVDFERLEETILNEGRYDKFATQLSKIAFEAIKDGHNVGRKVLDLTFTVGPDDEDIISNDFDFDFNIKVEYTDDEYKVDGGANAGFDDEGEEIIPLLTVNFKIPKEIDWQTVSFDLKDVIRHELEHLTQDGENVRPGKQMADDQFIRKMIDSDLLSKADYFKLEKEVDAMLQGLYFKAKKSKRPYIEVIDDYLDKQPISQQEREDILDLWRSRTKALSLPLFEAKYKLGNVMSEQEVEQKYKIYCDMDGVLTNFDAQFEKLSGGISPREYEERNGKDAFWSLISQGGVGFWVGMPWMPNGKQLWEYISKYNPTILSAPSRENESRLGKRLWVRNNLKPKPKLILSPAFNKPNYSGKNKILIDDRPDTIQKWNAEGGIGILFKSTEQVIKDLQELDL